jgi:hypothetical protein
MPTLVPDGFVQLDDDLVVQISCISGLHALPDNPDRARVLVGTQSFIVPHSLEAVCQRINRARSAASRLAPPPPTPASAAEAASEAGLTSE